MNTFSDKVVIVTGGSSGIGRATAIAFARAGASVVIAARGIERGEAAAQEIRTAGGEALFIRTDVAQSAQVQALIARTVEKYGRLDCAVNNAAASEGVFSLTADFSEEEFDRAIAGSLKSVWLCLKYELQQMVRQGGGAIVNTSSVNGLGGAMQGSLYSAAKAGVIALTKSASREYAAHGIRVNVLVPGAFRTPMLESVFERYSGGDAEVAKAVEEQYAQLTALNRIGRPEEAAEAALWLCSDAASYVTGHTMIVDGGMTSSFR
jgi:NAD(P)-dependent dehydrogenase (short-subunit alcohol dehydrogenase family)